MLVMMLLLAEKETEYIAVLHILDHFSRRVADVIDIFLQPVHDPRKSAHGAYQIEKEYRDEYP